jgi:hypothetical protein
MPRATADAAIREEVWGGLSGLAGDRPHPARPAAGLTGSRVERSSSSCAASSIPRLRVEQFPLAALPGESA